MSQRTRVVLGHVAESLFLATVCIVVPLLLMSQVAAVATGANVLAA